MTKYRIQPYVSGRYTFERLSKTSTMSGGGEHWQVIDIMDNRESAEKRLIQAIKK